jgi:phosphoglucomutase
MNKLKVNSHAFNDQKPGTSGIRILMHGGARIVYRLSGTGTDGATLRVYIEGHEADIGKQADEPQTYLAELIGIARQPANIEHFTGRNQPDVHT